MGRISKKYNYAKNLQYIDIIKALKFIQSKILA